MRWNPENRFDTCGAISVKLVLDPNRTQLFVLRP